MRNLSIAQLNPQKLKRSFLFILLTSQFCFAENTPEISILTCSPGNEVYSVFGHSAIRIVDGNTDMVYNFGMFDFETSNFTLKFVTGRLRYRLGIEKTENFIQQYSDENRRVSEQKLKLSQHEKMKLIEKLNFLYKPENRSYIYSFLNKNCSTEIRDLLMEVGVEFPKGALEKTNRDLINFHLRKQRWLRFGTNLLLGKSLDKKSTRFESMFLPIFLKQEIHKATLNGQTLVKSETVLNKAKFKEEINWYNWTSPIVVFSILLLVYLFIKSKSVESIFIFSIGSIGMILLAMCLFSDHPEVKNNLNILWSNPLYYFYLPVFKNDRFKKPLAYVLLTMLLVTILIWIVGYQSFDIGIIPLLIVLTLINLKYINRKVYSHK